MEKKAVVSRSRNVFVSRDAYCVLCSAAGGRNEETYSGYAEGIPVEQYPSSRQHKQISPFIYSLITLY
jgi:hypothetical protein